MSYSSFFMTAMLSVGLFILAGLLATVAYWITGRSRLVKGCGRSITRKDEPCPVCESKTASGKKNTLEKG